MVGTVFLHFSGTATLIKNALLRHFIKQPVKFLRGYSKSLLLFQETSFLRGNGRRKEAKERRPIRHNFMLTTVSSKKIYRTLIAKKSNGKPCVKYFLQAYFFPLCKSLKKMFYILKFYKGYKFIFAFSFKSSET